VSLTTQFYEEDLAYIHHVGFGSLAREGAPAVIEALRPLSVGGVGATVLELGCGSGILLSALAAAGYNTIGVDASGPMIDLARRAAPSATLIVGSLYDIEIPPCDAVIAMGEGLNYVREGETPPAAELFGRIAAALPEGGLFLFDVIVRGKQARATYRTWSAGPDWAALVEVEPAESGTEIRRGITTFRLVEGGYRRGHEEHFVHLFSKSVIREELARAGFRVQAGSSYGTAEVGPGRLVFVCRRTGGLSGPAARTRSGLPSASR
jgi:SAM-dependent methyltransferase